MHNVYSNTNFREKFTESIPTILNLTNASSWSRPHMMPYGNLILKDVDHIDGNFDITIVWHGANDSDIHIWFSYSRDNISILRTANGSKPAIIFSANDVANMDPKKIGEYIANSIFIKAKMWNIPKRAKKIDDRSKEEKFLDDTEKYLTKLDNGDVSMKNWYELAFNNELDDFI